MNAVATKAPEADTPAADSAVQPEAAATEAQAVKPDPFANLPHVKIGETENVLDLTGVKTSDPRKYGKVHEDAVTQKLPVMRGWKHSAAVFIPGTNKGGENGFKPGSVYGTIADIVNRAGRSGVTAQELVTQLRQRQMGANKRSHYCEALPPVGWSEGWISTAVTKNIVGVHPTKKAPALFTAPKDAEATPEQNAAAKKAAA